MEALLSAVLLRLSGLDALETNAKPKQPNGKRREPAGAGGREWRSVVGANRCRQPELAEGRVEDPLHLATVGVLDTLAANEKARVRVDDRERKPRRPVLHSEVPFEVHAPRRVGSSDSCEGLLRGLRCAHALQTARHREPAPAKNFPDGALRRQLRELWIVVREPRAKLLRSPRRSCLRRGAPRRRRRPWTGCGAVSVTAPSAHRGCGGHPGSAAPTRHRLGD